MTLSKKIRFEVFKRDKFTCQYCGESAPEVVLQVDHIHPVSKGGSDDITNLITSCRECNIGKSNRLLDDSEVIKKRQAQLEELQDKREQLEMMLEWNKELLQLDLTTVLQVSDFWDSLVFGHYLNDKGQNYLKKWIKQHSVNQVLEAMRISTRQYLEYDQETEEHTRESVEKAFRYIPRIIRSQEQINKKPYLKDLYYIRGILANRFRHIDKKNWQCIKLMESAHLAGVDIEDIRSAATDSDNWTHFKNTLNLLAEEQDG